MITQDVLFSLMHVLQNGRFRDDPSTRGVQYVMKTARYIPKFYIYTLHDCFHENVCFLAI